MKKNSETISTLPLRVITVSLATILTARVAAIISVWEVVLRCCFYNAAFNDALFYDVAGR